jgi:hypothetical protein
MSKLMIWVVIIYRPIMVAAHDSKQSHCLNLRVHSGDINGNYYELLGDDTV